MSKTFKELLNQAIENAPKEFHYDENLTSPSDVKELAVTYGHHTPLNEPLIVSKSFRELVIEANKNQLDKMHVDPNLLSSSDVINLEIGQGH